MCLKIECSGCLGAFECGLKFPNVTSFFVAVSVPPAITPNHSSTNRLLWIHDSRFLAQVSVTTVVFQHSTDEDLSCIIRVVKYMYNKTYLSFRFITSRPLCQIKQGDQTIVKNQIKTKWINKKTYVNTTKDDNYPLKLWVWYQFNHQ